MLQKAFLQFICYAGMQAHVVWEIISSYVSITIFCDTIYFTDKIKGEWEHNLWTRNKFASQTRAVCLMRGKIWRFLRARHTDSFNVCLFIIFIDYFVL